MTLQFELAGIRFELTNWELNLRLLEAVSLTEETGRDETVEDSPQRTDNSAQTLTPAVITPAINFEKVTP